MRHSLLHAIDYTNLTCNYQHKNHL
uniref:Uncharacterized protein n=1 Tax=Rhizophora mucronata TaxID=61149 RepID=A0A2P2IXL6_RHIMU